MGDEYCAELQKALQSEHQGAGIRKQQVCRPPFPPRYVDKERKKETERRVDKIKNQTLPVRQ